MFKEQAIYHKPVRLLYPNPLTTARSAIVSPVPKELMFGSVLLVPVHMRMTPPCASLDPPIGSYTVACLY